MFTRLEILPREERIIRKIKEKIKPPRIRKEYIQVKSGTPFLKLSVREDYFSWSEISLSLSGSERRILTDSEMRIPPETGLERGEFYSLGTVLMMKTALSLFEKAELPRNLSFALYDRNASCVRLLKKIVPFVRYASVYTEKISGYFYEASEIMRKSGMSIKVNEYSSFSRPADIVVADCFMRGMKGAGLIFLGRNDVVAYNTVTGEGFSLPEEYAYLCREGDDAFAFASALYESCSVRCLEESGFERLCFAGKVTDTEKLLEKCCSVGNT